MFSDRFYSKAHSCVEKAAMIGLVKIRLLETDENFSLRGETLQKAIQDDIDQGLVPFFVSKRLRCRWCFLVLIFSLFEGVRHVRYDMLLFV
jgi:hypothetical protein